ncbi:protein kinase [Nonomuraea sp. NPDC046570]|uniref:serine/threonine-protein kinase n=1 Tax=Nonomuraea sp. NPDC046570 TaxID=3155255 RepID=UPI0033E82010
MSERQQHAGRRVAGRYHLKEPIGRGGMGIVWRAHDELLDREVAVKEVRYAAVLGDEVQMLNRRTMREARAAARFTHPNVIVVHDVIEEDDRPWIVMQLVHSRSLGQVIKHDGPLTPRKVAEIGLAVLDALHGAHEAGVLHRDVKPENVLLADDGRVVLTDFGIATLETETALTMTGLAGTPAFIAPERLKGLPARRESDLWSLGATLHTALEGKAPHDRGMAMATMHAVLNDEPDPAEHAGPLRPVIDGLLAKEPIQRLTHEEATRLLRQAIAQADAESARAVPPEPAATPADVDDTPTDPSLPSVSFPQTGVPLPTPGSDKPGKPKPANKAAGKAAAPKAQPPKAASAPPTPKGGPSTAKMPAAEPWPEPVEPYRSEPYRAEPYRAEPYRSEPRRPEPAAEPHRPEPVEIAAVPAARDFDEDEPTVYSRKGVRRASPIIAIGAAVVVVAGVGAYLGLNSAPDNTANKVTPPVALSSGPSSTSAPAPSATPTTAPPSPSPTPEKTAAEIPAGWKSYKDKTGFSVALPKGWDEFKREGTRVYFRGPGASSNSFLMIDEAPNPGPDPHKDWKQQEKSARYGFGGYELLGIKKVDYMKAASDWEFTWRTNSGKSRVRNRGFITDNGRGYAIYWHTLAKNWKRDLQFFDTFASTFKPAK